MRVLITGIDGFVAPFLARLEKNTNEVFGAYLKEPIREKGINYILMDLLDEKAVDKVIADVKPDVIYHLAGFSSVADSWKTPKMAMKINAGGTYNLLNAVQKAGINPRIVAVSSADVYGNPLHLPISESHPLNPQSPYGESRIEQENIISGFKKLDVIISRSFSHTGPGQSTKFVCSDFAYKIAAIEKGIADNILMHGDIKIKRDFSDVRDIVRAYVLLARKGKPHQAYNVCSGKAYSIGQILDIFLRMSKSKIIKKFDSSKTRKADIPVLQGDNSKLVNDTGWKPEIKLEETLKELLEYWRNNI
ncbi:MAG: GDP-mannose 4,6-dehydratase [Candidatus Nanoarchaeia archaeon]|jgi:GDP-4-dehydro-6-deoxy-D-mannose reductase